MLQFKESSLESVLLFHKEHVKKLSKKPRSILLHSKKDEDVLKKLRPLLSTHLRSSNDCDVFDYNITDIEDIKKKLVDYKKIIGSSQSEVIKTHVVYGLWLEQLFLLHNGQFGQFCKKHLKMSIRKSQQIRKLAKLCTKYKKLQNLSVSVTKLIGWCSKIEASIDCNEEEQNFWRG